MNKTTWIILTLLAGALLPIQAGLNTRLGKYLSAPIYASMFLFLVGTIALMVYIILTRDTVSWSAIKSAPAYTWLGGVFGAFYVTVMIFAFPQLGPGLTFGLIVAGQMVFSVVLEHFHLLESQHNSFSLMKALGVALIIAGVVIIRKF